VRSYGLILVLFCASSLLMPPRTRADHAEGSERVDFTAYTLRRNEISLGVGAAAYGVLDEVTIGTYVPLWFTFPWLNAPIASAFVKLRDWFHGPVAASLRGAFVYLPASASSSSLTAGATTHVGFLVIPLELSISVRLHPRFSQSVQLGWVHVAAGGSRSRDKSLDLRIAGASAVTSLSLFLLSELRMSRVVALTLRASVLLDYGDLLVDGEVERNGTRVNAQLGVTKFYDGVVANIIPGIALSWSNVNLHLGVGVGSNWLPFLGLPIRVLTFVPDADLYVRF
jgi:hypothetical protein